MRLKTWRRRVLDPVVYAAAALSLRLLGECPRWLARAVAGILAGLLWIAHGHGRRLVLANLRTAYPEMSEKEGRSLGRQSFFHMIWGALEFMASVRHPERIHDRVELPDELCAGFAAGGASALLVLAHLGSWELLGHALPATGASGFAVAHRLRNPHLDRLVREARCATGLGIIDAKGAVRELLKALRSGSHVAMLIDQNTRLKEGGVFAEFFGLPVTVTRAPAMLARKLNLRVYAGTCVRVGNRYRAIAVPLTGGAAEFASDEALTQAMVSALETLIRAYPEQYAWMYKRWRYIPPEAPPELAARYPFYARVYEEGKGQWTES